MDKQQRQLQMSHKHCLHLVQETRDRVRAAAAGKYRVQNWRTQSSFVLQFTEQVTVQLHRITQDSRRVEAGSDLWRSSRSTPWSKSEWLLKPLSNLGLNRCKEGDFPTSLGNQRQVQPTLTVEELLPVFKQNFLFTHKGLTRISALA